MHVGDGFFDFIDDFRTDQFTYKHPMGSNVYGITNRAFQVGYAVVHHDGSAGFTIFYIKAF